MSQVDLERAIRTGAFTDEQLDWTVSLLRDTNTLANDMRASPAVVTPLRGLNRDVLLTDTVLARVTMPTLFLWGDEDPNGGRSIAEAFADKLPDSHLEMLTEAGHTPWLDRLDRCATATAEFLGR